MSKVVALAIDFKKFTPSVLETGLFLKKNIYPESEIVLFHAIEYFLTPPYYLLSYFKKEKLQLEKKLSELSQIFEKENISVKNKVILGNFWESLEDFIKNFAPYLIVLGYQPYRFKIPTAEKMLERLKSNFLIVRETPLQKIEKILCCIDFSEKSLDHCKMAIFWKEKLKIELKILNIIPEIKVIKDIKIKKEIINQEKLEREKLWQNLISSLEERERINDLEFEIVYGDKIEKILENIRNNSFHLLIVGKTGKSKKPGLGSIPKELLKRTQIPVLIVENF